MLIKSLNMNHINTLETSVNNRYRNTDIKEFITNTLTRKS